MQIIAGKAPGGGTQAFVGGRRDRPLHARRRRRAATRSAPQKGTGCGPSGARSASVRRLADPNVDPFAHARLSDGAINDVKEYDAKPDFGNVVYFMSNTTNVSVGGVARGMVRVGTPVAKVDYFTTCDPNSDGTLTWRYWSIRTGVAARPRLYGWIPGRCPAAIATRLPAGGGRSRASVTRAGRRGRPRRLLRVRATARADRAARQAPPPVRLGGEDLLDDPAGRAVHCAQPACRQGDAKRMRASGSRGGRSRRTPRDRQRRGDVSQATLVPRIAISDEPGSQRELGHISAEASPTSSAPTRRSSAEVLFELGDLLDELRRSAAA